MAKQGWLCGLGIVVLLTAVGCSSHEEQPTTVKSAAAATLSQSVVTFTAQPPAHTPTPILTSPSLSTATATFTPSPLPTATPTITPTPSPVITQLTVTLEKLCIHKTGDLPFSRADIYFSLRLVDPNGVSHTLREIPQTALVKKAASLDCADPLLFGDRQSLRVHQIEGICLRIEGEFWNANRFWDDTLVGKINEPLCYRQGQWTINGTISRHLTGGGADWELFLQVE